MGKNQKKSVKGAVQVTVTATPVTEVPVTTPPATSGGTGATHS
jgi:hypothetical protein